jgi:hypothetical protein
MVDLFQGGHFLRGRRALLVRKGSGSDQACHGHRLRPLYRLRFFAEHRGRYAHQRLRLSQRKVYFIVSIVRLNVSNMLMIFISQGRRVAQTEVFHFPGIQPQEHEGHRFQAEQGDDFSRDKTMLVIAQNASLTPEGLPEGNEQAGATRRQGRADRA